ncbi:MAG: FMN-binding negative transcriptional regulator [Novosphingobium sp.]
MHPNPAFRPHQSPDADRALMRALIDEIGFGMVFAATTDGPRVAHVPLLLTSAGTIKFHLARGNALARHIAGKDILAVINGPDGYVSPRWYADSAQVPTWNYVSLELEGPVQRMDSDGLLGLLDALSTQHEARLQHGTPWTMDKVPETDLRRMLSAIIGFELEVKGWRPTFKLSQNKPVEERERVIAGLETAGSLGIAQLMRDLTP